MPDDIDRMPLSFVPEDDRNVLLRTYVVRRSGQQECTRRKGRIGKIDFVADRNART